jgi:autotransporter-associated beta strand protein
MRRLSVIFFIVFNTLFAFGQTTYDWLDYAPDGNWKRGADGARWNPGELWDQPPQTQILRFNNNHQLSMTNNIDGEYSIHRIIFGDLNTSTRTIAGNNVIFNDFSENKPKIENSSSTNHIIQFPLKFGYNPMEINPVNGDLTVSSAINNNGNFLDVFGNNSKRLILSGSISGSGGISLKQNSVLELSGASKAYTGNTNIEAGTLELAVSISSNTIVVYSGAKLVVTGSNVTINDLTINSGGVLEILPTKSLTVNGSLTNNAGNTGIVIKSDESGAGSLKHSTAGVAATFERNFDDADWADPTDGWHYLSSPVAAQAISPGFVTDPISNYDMYVWYEPENLWVNHKNTSTAPTWATSNVISNGLTNNTSNFLVGKGYLVAYNDGGVKEFSGTLNVSDVNISDLTITGSTNANRSWHLLGNPFSCALTWDGTAAWNLSNISGVAKIWDESSRALVDLTSSPASIIPATNGFLVQVSSGTGSLTIPASKRDHSSLDFYKSSASTSRFLLTASTFEGESAQQSNIFVNPEASEGFDLLFDSEFLAGYAPQFYSIAGDIKLSTNTLPSLPDDAIIPFGFVKNEATQFNITMQEQISGYIVYLNDLLTGVEHNLTDQPVYSFTSAEGDDPNRFLLYFAPVSVNKPVQGNAYGIYSFAGQVYVSNTPSNAQITLSTLTGQVVMQRNAGGSGLVTLNAASLPKGVYIVTVQGEGARVSRKVVL